MNQNQLNSSLGLIVTNTFKKLQPLTHKTLLLILARISVKMPLCASVIVLFYTVLYGGKRGAVSFTNNLNRKDLIRQINRYYTEIDSHTSSTYQTINKEKKYNL